MAKILEIKQASDPFSATSENGYVFWLFGLSGAGKSTLANALCTGIRTGTETNPLLLDGDRLRSGLSKGLGFSDEDRHENIRRAAQVARLGLESGLIVVAAFITPRERDRRLIAEIVGPENLSLIHVATPLAVCQKRDVKGLYASAAAGTARQVTGIDSQFEPPLMPALTIETRQEMVHQSASKLLAYARPHFPKFARSRDRSDKERTG